MFNGRIAVPFTGAVWFKPTVDAGIQSKIIHRHRGHGAQGRIVKQFGN